MSLGSIHRDSILDLLALAEAAEKDGLESVPSVAESDCSLSDFPLEPSESECLIQENNDVNEKRPDVLKLASNAQKNASTSGQTSSASLNSLKLVTDAYDDYYDYSSYDPYAPSNAGQKEGDFNCFTLFCFPSNSDDVKKNNAQGPDHKGNTSDSTENTETSKTNASAHAKNMEELIQPHHESESSQSADSDFQEEKEQNSEEMKEVSDDTSPVQKDAVCSKNQDESGIKIVEGHDPCSKGNEVSSDGMRAQGGTIDLSEIGTTEKNDYVHKPKGILKKSGILSKSTNSTRRPLFKDIRYESSYKDETKINLKVQFSPMAKVITVFGRQHLTLAITRSIWWSRKDYEDFKKTGRMISKALEEGGSEIWLSSQYKKSPNKETDVEENFGEKWWCKFGHSRRGLEHIASMDEGKYRHENVMNSIKATLDEQTRQRIYGINDMKRLGTAALKYTSFARDLALAAGAVDAEAVRTNFSSKAAKRPHYKKLHEQPSNPLLDNSFLDGDTQLRLDALHIRRGSSELPNITMESKTNDKSFAGETDVNTTVKPRSLSSEAAGFGKDEKEQVNGFGMRVATSIGIVS